MDELLNCMASREERCTFLPEAFMPPGLELTAAAATSDGHPIMMCTTPEDLLAAVDARLQELEGAAAGGIGGPSATSSTAAEGPSASGAQNAPTTSPMARSSQATDRQGAPQEDKSPDMLSAGFASQLAAMAPAPNSSSLRGSGSSFSGAPLPSSANGGSSSPFAAASRAAKSSGSNTQSDTTPGPSNADSIAPQPGAFDNLNAGHSNRRFSADDQNTETGSVQPSTPSVNPFSKNRPNKAAPTEGGNRAAFEKPGLQSSPTAAATSQAQHSSQTPPPKIVPATGASSAAEDPTMAASAAVRVLPSGEDAVQALQELREDILEYQQHVYSNLSPLEKYGQNGWYRS